MSEDMKSERDEYRKALNALSHGLGNPALHWEGWETLSDALVKFALDEIERWKSEVTKLGEASQEAIRKVDGEAADLRVENERLRRKLEATEGERAARGEMLIDLRARLEESEAERQRVTASAESYCASVRARLEAAESEPGGAFDRLRSETAKCDGLRPTYFAEAIRDLIDERIERVKR